MSDQPKVEGSLECRHEDDRFRFVAEVGQERVGLIDYRLDGEVYDFTHTETDPAHQGQGIAGDLTRYALDTVRSLGASLRATCPYTANWIERHPDYADLLAS